ncbi:MAG: hypothetical protein V9G20_32270 [Candidatus Promineifilaceae bacterium]
MDNPTLLQEIELIIRQQASLPVAASIVAESEVEFG